jgi:hypothetical protein
LASRRRRSGGPLALLYFAKDGIMLSTIKELWKKVLALIQLETLTLDSIANDFRKGVTT